MNLSFDFTGRTALVTGASEGIGFELCWMLAEAGAKVVPVDRDARSVKSTWGNGSEFVLPMALDVADSKGAEEAVSACREWGGLDIVVNNVELARDAVDRRMDESDWDDAIALHVNGAFELTRAAIPLMRSQGKGRIVNVTSNAGMHGDAGQAKYSAARARITDFTQSVAKEVVTFGITINAVSPTTATENGVALSTETSANDGGPFLKDYFANPREISCAVGYLCSDEARHVTGVDLPIDGSMS